MTRDELAKGPKWFCDDLAEPKHRCVACETPDLLDADTGLCRPCWRVYRFSLGVMHPWLLRPTFIYAKGEDWGGGTPTDLPPEKPKAAYPDPIANDESKFASVVDMALRAEEQQRKLRTHVLRTYPGAQAKFFGACPTCGVLSPREPSTLCADPWHQEKP